MPRKSTLLGLLLVTAVAAVVFGDPRATPVTHALWARMLLRALEMDEAIKTSTHASAVFETLSGDGSRFFSADAYWRADGVVPSREGAVRSLSARDGVGEVTYAVPVAHGGDYVLRARAAGDPAHPLSAEIVSMSGAPATRSFRLVPARQSGWLVAGTTHLDPGTYKTSLLLPAGASVEYVEVAPPCVNPIEPVGGWKPAAITTAEDLAITAVKALDMEDALAPAASPLEHGGAELEREDAAPVPVAAGSGFAALKAGPKGLNAVLTVDLPEAGLYTVEVFGEAGGGQRWRADACRKAILCAGSPSGWRLVMSQSFSAGRHTLSAALADGAVVERVRLTRRKQTPADYVAALRRAGFDAGQGTVSRSTALAAMDFVRKLRAERQRQFCGDVREPEAPSPSAPDATVAAAGVSGAGAPAPIIVTTSAPLTDALLPPQEVASPVLPGPS
jgi:hypothetical protein